MNIGLFGGSFDPIHLGHINAIEEVRYALALDKIIVMPAYLSPHKQAASLDVETRVEAVKRALKDYSDVDVSTYEVSRAEQVYTYDSLMYLQERCPDDDITLIIGTDQYLNFNKWYNYQLILEQFRVAVVNRYHQPVNIDAPFVSVDMPVFEVSSTLIRQRLKAGAPFKHLVPHEVYTYLKETN